MKKRTKLNKKGKFLVFILFSIVALIVVFVMAKTDDFGGSSTTRKNTNKKDNKPEEKEVVPTPTSDDNKEDNGNTNNNNSNTTSKGFEIKEENGITYIDGILIANKTYSLPSDYNPGDLLSEFKENFEIMKNAAKSDGVNLIIGSGFRSYDRQNTLYTNYVNRDGKDAADKYSARPGHSEHQTGLAADIYGEASKDSYLHQSWENTNDGKWVNKNCYKYGFIIRYVKNKEDITGYIYEPWHIRYVGKDLAKKLYNNGDWITLEEYFGVDSKY